ncbi:YcxB family protein [Novosphingobium beihaiensis]|uniref:YcxB family protein n=1 Tax=Novosphingobium beihaiensis TaxID=2930389 RepID=A0ABT0BMD7_9SPHN|nr:YcxB family protein [Novosphingobium beihaiensis]MCJ2186215.1 YcxB family protein [Novosphingobium beihaiensis]
MLKRRWLWRGAVKYILIVGAAYSVLGVSTRFINDGASITGAIAEIITGLVLATAVFAAIWLYWLWCIPRSARNTWKQLHLDGLPTFYVFDDEGIRISNDRGSSIYEWPMICSWIENEHLMMLFRTKLMFHAIPKSQVSSEEIAKLRAALIAAEIPEKC